MRRIILAVLDGYGIATPSPTNAITSANTPFLDRMWTENPHATLITSGEDVGLPPGQMGNSEVGHLNIGAGRVVYQDITRIDLSIRTGEFYSNAVLLELIRSLKREGRALHLVGLVSDGGVHSSVRHIRAILETCKRESFDQVVIHVFTDGRDTPPHSGMDHVRMLQSWTDEFEIGKIATVIGRYYAMDRDKRWDRLEKAYRALCHGEGNVAASPIEAIQASYDSGVTDEFILPAVIQPENSALRIKQGDGILFFNFRSDRARQLTQALTNAAFSEFECRVKVDRYVTMTQYHEAYTFPVLFPPQQMTNLLGGVLADQAKKQLRLAETEKYPHVTFFFNGGDDTPFPGEDRILVQSPKVATYDMQPEMSEPEVTSKLCEAILSKTYDFICVNFANCDMVGHTGVLDAAIKAVEAANHGAERMCAAAVQSGYAVLITADHGNAEQMWDPITNGPHTAHTTNPVPVALVNADPLFTLRDGGRLADLAPTVLESLGIAQPSEMTGRSLLCSNR
ncbi:MAG: 2,3-bisphosphoglycerate-independent phosphoglycerate mutase [bacterium]|nr:2,3-bisphosphoglycerate-independent phosphoglycerate mutase [bacterium]